MGCVGVSCALNETCHVIKSSPTCLCDDGFQGNGDGVCTPIVFENLAEALAVVIVLFLFLVFLLTICLCYQRFHDEKEKRNPFHLNWSRMLGTMKRNYQHSRVNAHHHTTTSTPQPDTAHRVVVQDGDSLDDYDMVNRGHEVDRKEYGLFTSPLFKIEPDIDGELELTSFKNVKDTPQAPPKPLPRTLPPGVLVETTLKPHSPSNKPYSSIDSFKEIEMPKPVSPRTPRKFVEGVETPT